MKKLTRLLVFTALVTTLALPALAQNTQPTTTTTTAATPATQDDAAAKTALYDQFRNNIKASPQTAYEAGKEYLQKYEAKDGAEDQYIKYIKKWVAAYDKVARRNQFSEEIRAKNYNAAFATGKQILSEDPNDVAVLYDLLKAGYISTTGGTDALNADSANYARRLIQLVQEGKNPEPTKSKDEVLGNLNYALGLFTQKSMPQEAVTHFLNAAQFEGSAKKDPQTYLFLADAYEKGQYSKLATQYNASCKTDDKVNTPECVELKAKADAVVDLMIDALARAIAYNDASPNAARNAQARAGWLELLTNYYKYRKGSDAGITEMIAGITAKPLPKPGDAATTPTTTPASNTTAPTQPSGTTSTSPAGTTQPSNGTNATTTKTTP